MNSFAIAGRRRGILLGVGVFIAVMALVAAAFRIAHNERAFEMNRWAIRLHAASAQRLGMVNDWLSESRSALRAVAVNPTVQIYLSQAAANPAAPETPENQAQAAFLQSYIISLGGRGPFASPQPSTRSGTGIAVLDAHRHLVAATFGYRPSAQTIAALMAEMHEGAAGPSLSQAKDGSPVAFVEAVRPIQGMMSAPAVGYVIGERVLDQSFWSGSSLGADRGHESLIASGRKNYLVGSSLNGTLAGSGEALAAATPLTLQREPGLDGKDALHFGVPVKGTNWVLVESVGASSALAGVEERIRNLLTILLLSLLAIILGVLLLWRHMTAVQQAASREAGVKLYRGITEVLLQAIDQRDPGTAEHSRRVAALSRQIALRIGASNAEADTVELAGALMNVGKLFVPVEVLTKAGGLEETEASRFAEGSERWLALLGDAPLDPPLEPLLRDAYRLGRRANGAPVSRNAYIIVIANSAVALMSPRAYRLAHSPAETLKILSNSQPEAPAAIQGALRHILSAMP